MNKRADVGLIPEKLSVNTLEMVTAGLAKLVETVAKYAVPIHAGTR